MTSMKKLRVYACRIAITLSVISGQSHAIADQDTDYAAGRWVFVEERDTLTGALNDVFAASKDVDGRGNVVIACNEARFAELIVAFEWKAPMRHNPTMPTTLYFQFDKFAMLSSLEGKYGEGKYYTDQGAFLAAGMLKAGRMRVTVNNPKQAELEFSLESYSAAYDKLRQPCKLP